jgi:hypothetical protein
LGRKAALLDSLKRLLEFLTTSAGSAQNVALQLALSWSLHVMAGKKMAEFEISENSRIENNRIENDRMEYTRIRYKKGRFFNFENHTK